MDAALPAAEHSASPAPQACSQGSMTAPPPPAPAPAPQEASPLSAFAQALTKACTVPNETPKESKQSTLPPSQRQQLDLAAMLSTPIQSCLEGAGIEASASAPLDLDLSKPITLLDALKAMPTLLNLAGKHNANPKPPPADQGKTAADGEKKLGRSLERCSS